MFLIILKRILDGVAFIYWPVFVLAFLAEFVVAFSADFFWFYSASIFVTSIIQQGLGKHKQSIGYSGPFSELNCTKNVARAPDPMSCFS